MTLQRPVIGAFVPSATWGAWDSEQARQELAALKAFGINTIVTESDTYRDDVIDLVHQADMRFMGGIACFVNHGDILQQRPELWPVLQTGERRPQMEWYTGITPTIADYNQARLDAVERIIRDHDLDGFCLDFVRWPLHWEQELRPDRPEPLDSSFDPHTVRQFLSDTGLELPADRDSTPAQADWILTNHRSQWVDFKCQVITDFVRQARERCGALPLGAYIVPAPEAERARLVGQRLRDLAPLLDFAAPMVYHAIQHRPPSWVGEMTREVAQYAATLPVLQVRAADDIDIKSDWGPPISPDEWRQVLGQISADLPGFIAFTSPLLKHENRGAILRNRVAQIGWAGPPDR